MWKCLVLLVLVPRAVISQPVVDEKVRDTRQLSFGDCCPCPGSERSSITDQDVFDTDMIPRDDCPCRTASDSDAASSIFTPAMRAVEPFVRQTATHEEPKPLLKPEVGLASSVLETLREVTDQEYQEALARDAARNAIDTYKSSSSEQDEPKSIVNIILKSREDQTDDAISEASHVQETRCVHSPLGKSNLDERGGLPVPLFRNSLLTLPKVTSSGLLHKTLFDMDNSASNIQENVLMPLKNNLLEDLKQKSDLLKLKLFPSIGNSLGDNKNIDSELSRISKLKLPSLFDQFKNPEGKEYLPLPSTVDIGKERESDVAVSPSNSIRYLSNNDEKFSNNDKLHLQSVLNLKKPLQMFDRSKSSSSVHKKPIIYSTNKIEEEILSRVSEDNNLSGSSDCEPNITKGNFQNRNDEAEDGVSSPSEIAETELYTPNEVAKSRMNEECETEGENSYINNNNIDENIEHTDIEEVVPSNLFECPIEENADIGQTNNNNVVDDDTTYKSKEVFCEDEDSDTEASVVNPQITQLQEEDSNYVPFNDENVARNVDSKNFNDMHSNEVDTLVTTTEKIITNNIPNTNTLPDIKGNILKTIENFKKTNERIQEKLKSNVQNALQLLGKTTPKPELNSNSLNTTNDENDKFENKIQIEDLQEMSNRILNLSTLNEKDEARTPSQTAETLVKDSPCDNSRTVDSTYEASDLNSAIKSSIAPSETLIPITTLPKSAIDNSDDVMASSDSIQSPCNEISPQSSNLLENKDRFANEENREMFTDASSPVVSNLQRIIEPNSNVKTFFDNLKSSVSDMFSSNNDLNLFPLINDNVNDNSVRNEQISLDKSLPSLKNAKLSKNPNSNLNLYRARVAVPESLNIKSLPVSITQESNSKNEYRTPGEKSSFFNTLTNRMDSLNPINIRTKINNRKDSASREHEIMPFQKVLSRNNDFDSLTENTFRNIQGAFDGSFKRPFTRKQDKILSNTSPNLLQTMAITNDELGEKIKAFHSELNDRLSSFSQKISSISPLQLQNDQKFRTTKTNLNDKISKSRVKSGISLATRKPILKTSNTHGTLKASDISNSKIKLGQKSNFPSKQLSLDSKKSSTITRPLKSKDDIKSTLKDIKLKPLRENKVTITISTTARPKLMPRSKASSSPTKSKSVLTTNWSLKRPELRSNLKTYESKALPSEPVESRVPFSGRPATNTRRPTFGGESSEVENVNNPRSNSESGENILSETTEKTVLSRLREAVKARTKADANKKIARNNVLKSVDTPDTSLSASNLKPINTSVLKDRPLKYRPLKENVNYKCKMMCFEDDIDS